jgi:uncharacterized protein YrrD
MLRRLRDLENWGIESRDNEEVGTVEDFNFDDQRWTVRYLSVKTGGWFDGRPVLISVGSVRTLNRDTSRFAVDLTRDQIKNAPMVGEERGPITRRYEMTHAKYYGYPYYWTGADVWGSQATPFGLSGTAPGSEPLDLGGVDATHLHSANEVSGYHIRALDGEIGHVEEFMFDSEAWTIRYLVLDTSNWIGGRTVLVSPDWVRKVDWPDQLIHLDMTRDSVKNSPQYDSTVELNREYEDQLHRYYQRTAYWKE